MKAATNWIHGAREAETLQIQSYYFLKTPYTTHFHKKNKMNGNRLVLQNKEVRYTVRAHPHFYSKNIYIKMYFIFVLRAAMVFVLSLVIVIALAGEIGRG